MDLLTGAGMLKKRIYVVLMISVTFIVMSVSCDEKRVGFKNIELSAAPYLKIGEEALKTFAPEIKPDPGSRYTLHVVIYSYSQGKETISMAGESSFITETGSGKLKALVKIMDGENLMKAEFIEVSGKSMEQIFQNLSRSVSSLKWE